MRRVVVTGLGVVSALGIGRERHFEGLREEGRVGIGPLTRTPTEHLAITIGAEVPDFEPAELFSRSELSLYDRVTQMALIAGRRPWPSPGSRSTRRSRRGSPL